MVIWKQRTRELLCSKPRTPQDTLHVFTIPQVGSIKLLPRYTQFPPFPVFQKTNKMSIKWCISRRSDKFLALSTHERFNFCILRSTRILFVNGKQIVKMDYGTQMLNYRQNWGEKNVWKIGECFQLSFLCVFRSRFGWPFFLHLIWV